MSNEEPLENIYFGVTKNADGSPNFSRSIKTENKLHQIDGDIRFQEVLSEAEKIGLNEDKLRILIQTMHQMDSTKKNGIVIRTAHEIHQSKETVLEIARRYQKEKIRLTENGDLLHYHQTSLQNFESSVSTGGLLSYNKLKEMGKAPKSSGSRPDVVLMTRDSYDSDGNIKKAGLVDKAGLGAQGGGVSLVFDESIMDEPYYDCIDEFPNLPAVPFEKLKAVLASTEEKEKVEEILRNTGIQAEVTTRAEWKSRLNNTR